MTFSEQFPIVVEALNGGFLQTLKLFFVTPSRSNPPGTYYFLRIYVPILNR